MVDARARWWRAPVVRVARGAGETDDDDGCACTDRAPAISSAATTTAAGRRRASRERCTVGKARARETAGGRAASGESGEAVEIRERPATARYQSWLDAVDAAASRTRARVRERMPGSERGGGGGGRGRSRGRVRVGAGVRDEGGGIEPGARRFRVAAERAAARPTTTTTTTRLHPVDPMDDRAKCEAERKRARTECHDAYDETGHSGSRRRYFLHRGMKQLTLAMSKAMAGVKEALSSLRWCRGDGLNS